MSKEDYLTVMANTLRPFLPRRTKWFGHTEEARVYVSVFRVYRVPYSQDKMYIGLTELGQVRAVFVNVSLPYPEFDVRMKPTPEGSAKPDVDLVGWRTTGPGFLLLLMTPLKGDHPTMGSQVAAARRIDTARAVIVGNMSLNAAFERICEFSVNYRGSGKPSIDRTSPIMENPLSYPVPDIHDESTHKLIGSILEGIDALDKPTQDRVQLALRWYQRALGERRAFRIGAADVDSLINYWVAFETLVRVGERKVAGTLIRELSEIHRLSSQEAGQTFPISKIYERRSEIVHGGQLRSSASFQLQQFLSDVFVDILVLRTLRLPGRPRTENYLDGSAYDYL